jgi:DNA-binding response OmpR family regulator
MSDVTITRARGRIAAQNARAFVFMGSALANLVSHELSQSGFSLGRASSAEQALEMLSLERYDLLVMGLLLPDGTNAVDLTRALRHDRGAVSRKAWVLVHAHEVADSELRAIKNAGVSSLILGPVSLGAICDRIRMMYSDKRTFVEGREYVGPDRRVRTIHFPGAADRRSLRALLSSAASAGAPEDAGELVGA